MSLAPLSDVEKASLASNCKDLRLPAAWLLGRLASTERQKLPWLPLREVEHMVARDSGQQPGGGYRSVHDGNGVASKMGSSAEEDFLRTAESCSAFRAFRSTLKADKQHVDCVLVHADGKRALTVDVKADKSIGRCQPQQSKFLWLELWGEHMKPGWLLESRASVLACGFACSGDRQQPLRGFLLFDRVRLAEWTLRRVRRQLVHMPEHALWRMYRRPNKRSELSTLVPMLEAFGAAGLALLHEDGTLLLAGSAGS